VNDLSFPGFATGGFVGALRFADGGHVQGRGAVLNLSIDGQQFNGLHAPEPVAQKLTRYAISRQTTSTGVKPTWTK